MLNNIILVEVKVKVNAPQAAVWAAMTDWEAHSRWIPFTKVKVLTPGDNGNGLRTRFVGRTGIGFLAFDDVMLVERFAPATPQRPIAKCQIKKESKFLQGFAYFHIYDLGDNTSEILWVEKVYLPSEFIMKNFRKVLSWFGNLAFKVSLKKFAKIVERSASL